MQLHTHTKRRVLEQAFFKYLKTHRGGKHIIMASCMPSLHLPPQERQQWGTILCYALSIHNAAHYHKHPPQTMSPCFTDEESELELDSDHRFPEQLPYTPGPALNIVRDTESAGTQVRRNISSQARKHTTCLNVA